ncbi:hypothetical protein EII34_06470 [Arachnia propionica]|uniref:Pyrrolo-quinoline quinone repeat domain-containing protein n=1 Tax=Arachnia propionica TaxID=1750 RepID=A0A3P1TA93_9ACTN|nr:PQQ-binding-like beta-propeller repeat protein [Arachnia propionica]RRD05373.1 hypothetical protein EII34_06470 [Arachnia propionica]
MGTSQQVTHGPTTGQSWVRPTLLGLGLGLGTIGVGLMVVTGAGLGLRKAVTDLSPVLSVTAEAPATLSGMPGPLPDDTVTGELVATFTSSDLTGDVQVNPGARGPILSDDNTVIAVDGATGEQLWQHQLQNWKAHLTPAGRLMTEGWDDRLVLSPDGTAAALVVLGEHECVLTVLDGLTGQVRFTRSFPCHKERISVTDHVVVVGRTAHDIHTGEQRWSTEDSREFLPGTNTSSRLVVLPDISAADDPVPGCKHCIVTPVPVVSDQDPNEVVAQLDRAVRNPPEQQLKLHRGWTLVHDPSDGSNSWVDIETLESRQAPAGDPELVGSYTGFPKCFGSSGPAQVLDSWTGRVWEAPEADDGVGDDPLADNARVSRRSGTKELTLIRGDGEPLVTPIPLPAPEGKSYSSGSWDIKTTVRTRDGGATLLRWKGESNEEQPILLAIHR